MSSREIARPLREEKDAQLTIFDIEPDWRRDWWGMPSFEMGDARPQRKITVNFMTSEDVAAFASALGLSLAPRADSTWFPPQKFLKCGAYYWDGPKADCQYPVCIPSKGRANYQTTAAALDCVGVSYRFFVEETEYEDYCAALGESKVVRLPFHDLGQGSIPARNFIWDWAKEHSHHRHWVVDDNLLWFFRCTNNRRLRVRGGAIFRAMEDFVDRYENVAMAGPHHDGFIMDRDPNLTPYLLNSRVYSCILLDTSLPHRWRGRYNEDTDLSLRVLKDGHSTVLFRSLLMKKADTAGSKDGAQMPGGNTDNVYNADPTRRAFAESLRDQHPDVVKVVWKFNRWHHQVDYSPFKRNRLRLRPGVTPTQAVNEYGMRLVRAGEADGPEDAGVEESAGSAVEGEGEDAGERGECP